MKVLRVTTKQRDVLANVNTLFTYDFSYLGNILLPPDTGTYDTLEHSNETIDEYIGNPKKRAYLFVEKNTIVGFAMVHLNTTQYSSKPETYIHSFWIYPPWRKKGWGRYCFGRLARLLPEGPAGLYVMRENTRARKFWEAVLPDFKRTRKTEENGRFDGYYYEWNNQH